MFQMRWKREIFKAFSFSVSPHECNDEEPVCYPADDNSETLHIYSTLSCPKGCDKLVNILVLSIGTPRPSMS